MGKTYAPVREWRPDAGSNQFGRVWVAPDPEDGREPYPLEHHVHHSPDGHSWGYGGSGPSELAKDMLWDLLGERPDPSLYQRFKDRFITTLPIDSSDWRIVEDDIRAWLATDPLNLVSGP